MSFASTAQMVNKYNRSLQRKGRNAFSERGLPVMSSTTRSFLEPAAPEVAARFRARTERERQRKQMAVGLLLILVVGISAALVLAIMGML